MHDQTYREIPAPQGRGHVAYHLAREAFTTGGALVAAVPAAAWSARGHRSGWLALAASVGGYLAGQWSRRRTAGSAAPTATALGWHVATSVLLVTGTALLLPTIRRRAAR